MAFLTGSKQVDDQDKTAKNLFMTTLMQNNVLVTGAYGQLGRELQRVTKRNDNFIYYFTDADTLDITDRGAIDQFVKDKHIKYIINCAAYTAVDKAEDDSELCYKINRDAVTNLAITASKYGARIIHISTDYVFDGTNKTPYVETDTVCPKSVYGQSKAEGEQTLLKHCPDSIIIRTAWLYSSFGNNFVKTMIKLGKERETLNVVADQIGTPTYANDLARVIDNILNYSIANGFEAGIYHYSNEGITTWYDFTIQIRKDAGITTCLVTPISTDQYPTKAIRPQYSVLDKTKIKRTFDIDIPDWQTSLNNCIKELLAQ